MTWNLKNYSKWIPIELSLVFMVFCAGSASGSLVLIHQWLWFSQPLSQAWTRAGYGESCILPSVFMEVTHSNAFGIKVVGASVAMCYEKLV